MKIAFASCTRFQSGDPQAVWQDIQAERPDAVLLLGDNVYLDHDKHSDPGVLAAELASLYETQFAEPHFKALLNDLAARGAPLLAIYDDHDFLGNDRGGGEAPQALRDAARDALIRAFHPPQTGTEVYASQRLGPVRVLMLDTRYHRDSVAASGHDRDAILGARQWAWLEDELAKNDTPFLALVSSTTFHRWRSEAWEFYPAAFARLRDLLRHRPGALLLSGDIHANALYDDSGVIEIVSSGAARRGLLFGGLRKNYGVLFFDANGVDVDLRSLKPGDRYRTRIDLASWELS